jgi:hypothetical protein
MAPALGNGREMAWHFLMIDNNPLTVDGIGIQNLGLNITLNLMARSLRHFAVP